jgi:hypothetical protein
VFFNAYPRPSDALARTGLTGGWLWLRCAANMPLPNFIIIGTAKSATTSLYNYLNAHPQVGMSREKEANYFGWNNGELGFPASWRKEEQHDFPATTLEAYAELFPDDPQLRALGEASPLYLDSPHAPGRIRAELPDVRLMVTLRKPVKRIISYYKLLVRKGWVTESLEESLRPGKILYELSFIGGRLERYYELFPRERIHAIRFDDLKHRPEPTMRAVWRFLEVDPDFVGDWGAAHNEAPAQSLRTRILTSENRLIHRTFQAVDPILRGPVRHGIKRIAHLFVQSKPQFPEDLRRRIEEMYAPDVHKVEALTGLDLGAWYPSESASCYQPPLSQPAVSSTGVSATRMVHSSSSRRNSS